MSTYVRATASDPENRAAVGTKLGAAIQRSLDNGIAPSVQTMAMYTQLATTEPGLAEQATHIQASVEGMRQSNIALGQPPSGGQAYIDSIKASAQGADLFHGEVATQARDFYDKGRKALTDDPYNTAVAQGWDHGKGAPSPIDLSDPQKAGVAFQQRSDMLNSIDSHTGQKSGSVIEPAALPQVQSDIAGGDGSQIRNIAQSIAGLPEGQRQATLAAIGPSIAAAAKSGDPAKMAAAYGFMGQAYDKDPIAFGSAFGEGAIAGLTKWQMELQYMPPAEIAKQQAEQNDPANIEATKRIDEAAKKETDAISAAAVAAKFDTMPTATGNPFTAGLSIGNTPYASASPLPQQADAMRQDYVDAYKLMRQQTSDPSVVDAGAVRIMGQTWGMSAAMGNQVMRYPPEAHYPEVDGSHDYIGRQLDKTVKDVTGAATLTGGASEKVSVYDRPYLLDTAATANSRAVYNAPRSLIPDKTTAGEIAAGKPPSYYIGVQDSKGLWNALTDQNTGRIIRFRPDPQAVPSVAATHVPGYTTGNQARPEIMLPLDKTTM